jgi:glycosyltransferase involved in cell wall biosynthesis
MKISIAVASFNYHRYLASCLVSIAKQTHRDIEVLIVDGGSKDGSLDLIKDFTSTDARFRLVSTADAGQADGLVKAFAHATGEIACFLNADDVYLCNDTLASVAEAFAAYPQVDILSFGGYYIDEQGRHLKPVRLRYHPLDDMGLMKYRTAVLQPATFWRRRVMDAVPIEPRFHFVFDVVFFYEAFRQFCWLELGKPVAGYRLHGANKSMTVRPARIKELAEFERIKFGTHSLRGRYLDIVATAARLLGHVPAAGQWLQRLLYLAVNSAAFASVYRLPGI